MNENHVDNGKTAMRGIIHTHGIATAAAAAANLYAAPFNPEDRDTLTGMILAAYEAGQLAGIETAKAVS